MTPSQFDPLFTPQKEQQDFNLKAAVLKYLAYWKWFTVSFILAGSAAFLFLNYQTPEYRIQASILLKDEKKGLGQDDILKQLDIFSSNKVVENEIEILRSFTLMEKVVRSLQLNISYMVRDGLRQKDLYTESPVKLQLVSPTDNIYEKPLNILLKGNNKVELNGQLFSLNKVEQTPFGTLLLSTTGKNDEVKELRIIVQPLEQVVESNLANLIVESTNKMASVLILSINTPTPQKGKDLLNRLVDEYNRAAIEDKNKVASITLAFIEERLKLIAGDLSAVEKNVEDYKSREGITDISEESKLFLSSVKENDSKLNEVKIQQSVLDNIEIYVKRKSNGTGTVPATLGISDPTLLGLIQKLSELEMQRTSSIKMVRVDNPIIVALDDQINNLKQSILDNIQTLKSNIQTSRNKLESVNSRMESMIRTVPRKERELVDISRQQTIKNNLFIYLLQKREETALSYASAVPDSRTIDLARSGSKPVKPVRKTIFLLFGLVAVAAPLGIIYLIDMMNDKIHRLSDIEKQTKVPLLAEVTFAEHEEALVVSKLGRSVIAEQIRTLRTNLQFLSPNKKLQSILFTSSMSGEGKSFISLNLGASLAMTGKKTVILELDMRKPKLHPVLNINNRKGLSNYLAGHANINDIIQSVTEQENYYIITCGPIPPNPVELLMSDHLHDLFNELKKQFDYIIIDAPPVGIVTDAQILEQFADSTLYILRHDFTPKERLKFVDSIYKEKRFKNLNLIFNAIKEGGKYGYYYGYGYGYGYYELPNETKGIKLNGRKKTTK